MCCFLICYMYSRHESQYCTTTNAKVPATFMCGTGTALAGYWVDKILIRNRIPPLSPGRWNRPNHTPAHPLLKGWIDWGIPSRNRLVIGICFYRTHTSVDYGWQAGSKSVLRSCVSGLQGCTNIPQRQQNTTYGGKHCHTKRWATLLCVCVV